VTPCWAFIQTAEKKATKHSKENRMGKPSAGELDRVTSALASGPGDAEGEGLDLVIYHRGCGAIHGTGRALTTDDLLMETGAMMLPEDTRVELVAMVPLNGRRVLCRLRGVIAAVSARGLGIRLGQVDGNYSRYLAAKAERTVRATTRSSGETGRLWA
jgi:hypothetical protein